MAIEYVDGDLLAADVDALVNPVNCVGVMGKGLALQFKRAYPGNYDAYVAACRNGEVRPGRMFTYETGEAEGPRLIVNFPTKRHWRDGSRIEDIEAGLRGLVWEIATRGILSVALPAVGCGLGGLEWPEIRERIESTLGGLGAVRVVVYPPHQKGGGIGRSERPEG